MYISIERQRYFITTKGKSLQRLKSHNSGNQPSLSIFHLTDIFKISRLFNQSGLSLEVCATYSARAQGLISALRPSLSYRKIKIAGMLSARSLKISHCKQTKKQISYAGEDA